MTHTPGPWNVGLREDQTIFTENLRVATVECPRKEWKANARLIAAAPDMLAALKALHAAHRAFSGSEDWGVYDDEAREAAEAAIAKAEEA